MCFINFKLAKFHPNKVNPLYCPSFNNIVLFGKRRFFDPAENFDRNNSKYTCKDENE